MSGKIAAFLGVARHLRVSSRGLSCQAAAITKLHRKVYERTYPVVLVQSNGSSMNIRYHEPRQIIQLPLNVAELTEAQRKARLAKRRPKTVIKIEEETEDGFDAKKYLKYVKK